jgi:hypothetical protein
MTQEGRSPTARSGELRGFKWYLGRLAAHTANGNTSKLESGGAKLNKGMP